MSCAIHLCYVHLKLNDATVIQFAICCYMSNAVMRPQLGDTFNPIDLIVCSNQTAPCNGSVHVDTCNRSNREPQGEGIQSLRVQIHWSCNCKVASPIVASSSSEKWLKDKLDHTVSHTYEPNTLPLFLPLHCLHQNIQTPTTSSYQKLCCPILSMHQPLLKPVHCTGDTRWQRGHVSF